MTLCAKCGARPETGEQFCTVCGTGLPAAVESPSMVTVQPVGEHVDDDDDEDDDEVFGDTPGKIGNYNIHGLLAQGGMANVYVAEMPGTSGRYALKTLKSVKDPQIAARFEREILICIKVRHKNICQLVDWGFTPARVPYLVMELLEGQVLSRLIEDDAPMPVDQTRVLMLQLLQGLDAIHKAGVVHRDLKPANVFVTHEGVLKIMDFGIARREGMVSLTMSGIAVGTALFMAPEQLANAKHVDFRADLFNVGILAYLLLSRHHPFDAASLDKMLLRVVKGEATPLSTWCPDLPPSVLTWVQRLMEPDPSHRYQSARVAQDAMTF